LNEAKIRYVRLDTHNLLYLSYRLSCDLSPEQFRMWIKSSELACTRLPKAKMIEDDDDEYLSQPLLPPRPEQQQYRLSPKKRKNSESMESEQSKQIKIHDQ
ncbi:unnamed protein product, partial [Didymodactylos carnosus]